MGHLPFIDLVGWWLSIFLTFCILSFLYKDNPIYKIAEHLFIGISIGYVVTQQIYNTVLPKLIDRLEADKWWYWAAVLLSLMLLTKAVSQRWGWLARFPIAFVVAFFAGIQVNGALKGDFGPQMVAGIRPVVVSQVDLNAASAEALTSVPGFTPDLAAKVVLRRGEQPFASVDELYTLPDLTDVERTNLAEARGLFGGNLSGVDAQAGVGDDGIYWLGTFSQILMLLGLLSTLVYFYFSVEHKGAVGRVSRFGIWILMLGFGAAFGATVQGRLSLAIGRALDVLGRDKDPAMAAQIHGGTVALFSIAAIVTVLAIWERRRRG
jgi:hypothetical protein